MTLSLSPLKAAAGRKLSPGPRGEVPFLVLPENALAHAATMALSEKLNDTSPQIVFLYGPSGVGKTHLAQQFLQRVRAADRQGVILCKQATEFVEELADAAQAGTVPQFQLRFAEVDCLIIEDFHVLEGCPETQQQLLARVDQITSCGGRVLFTSRRSPGEIKGANEQLINRCLGGVCAAIRLPAGGRRQRLLEHFAGAELIPLPDDAAAALAAELSVSPRELRAAVIQLETAARLAGCRIDTAFVHKHLKHEAKQVELGLSDVTRAVVNEFGISVARIRSKNRSQELVLARQCAMYLARELTDKRLEEIGRYFGNRDHATVVYACHRIKARSQESAELRRQLAQILKKLNVGGGPEC